MSWQQEIFCSADLAGISQPLYRLHATICALLRHGVAMHGIHFSHHAALNTRYMKSWCTGESPWALASGS